MKNDTLAKGQLLVRSAMTRTFWAGVFAHAFIVMFYQDLIGKEEYLSMVEDRWVDLHWSLGLALAAVCVWYYNKVKVRVCGYDPLP